MEDVRGLSVQDARQDSVPGMHACITRSVPEKELHSTPAHRALQVVHGERKPRVCTAELQRSTQTTTGPQHGAPMHDREHA